MIRIINKGDNMKKIVKALGIAALMLTVGCNSTKEEAVNTVEEEVTLPKQSIEADGEVSIPVCTDINLGFNATITEVKVKDGQVVHKGDILLTFDHQEYLDKIEEQVQQINIKKAELEKLKKTINPLAIEVNGMKSEYNVVQGYINNGNNPEVSILESKIKVIDQKLQTANNDYKLKLELYNAGGEANSEVDKIEQNIKELEEERKTVLVEMDKIKENNRLQAEKLKSQINSVAAQISNEDEEIAASVNVLNEEIKYCEMQLNALKERLNKAYIKNNTLIATADNMVIYDINAMNGAQVSGEQSLMKGMDTNRLIVSLDVPIEDINSVKPGTKVSIKSYADKSVEILGEVAEISNRVTEVDGDKVVKVEVEVTQNKEQLRIGEEVEADMYINE